MLKVAAALLFFLFFVRSALAGPGDLEIRLLNEKRKEMAAGSTSNVLIMLINNTGTTKEVQLKLNTPDNSWRQVTDYSSILIEKNSVSNKIISIHIPESIKAGDYFIELEAFEKPGNQPFGKVNIPIYVQPRYEIRVDKLKASRFLFSGDTVGVKFLISNLSNLEVKVAATIISDKKLEIRNFRIPMDSTILTNVSVSIPKKLSNYTQLNITLSASIADKPESESSGSYSFDIIPSGNVKFDGYNRMPVKVSGIFATTNRKGKRDYGTMFDIRGGGLLSETKNQKLEFHLRGPDRGGNPILGLDDEYYLTYSTPRTEIFLGDNNYRLSDLTESSRSGRGIKLQYNFDKLSVGSFFHLPRYYPEIKQIFSFYSNYRINQKFRFSTGYLTKIDTTNEKAHLLTISGLINPFSWITTEFELVAGLKQDKMTKALRATSNINFSVFTSHFSFTGAEQGFPGYFSNSMYISSGITASLKKKLGLSLNYDLNRSNLALDTLYANAPYSKNINFMTSYRMNPNNSISFGVYMIGQEDRAAIPLFNYNKYSGRLSLQNKFWRINLNLQGELGKITNFLGANDGDMTDFYNGYFSFKYAFNESLSASGFVNYQGGQQYLITGFHRFYYGGSLQASLKKKMYVSLDYQSNYELKEYFRERSLLSFQMHHQLNPNHEFELSTNYNLAKNSLDKKELSIQFRYTYTINLPLSKKKNIGSLTGKVINMGGIEHVEGIIFNLNGNITMTDKNGNFKFPMVKTGTYILAMDESDVRLNTIASVPGPYRVTIESGKETRFEISLTQSARIQGRLVIREDQKSGQKGYFPVKEEIDKLIIEASGGTETFRILTQRDGSFSFEDLRPGNWRIKVYSNGIPQGYQLESDQFNFNLTPGKEENLDVIIYKKSREVKFQKSFKVIEKPAIIIKNSENELLKYNEAQAAMNPQQEKSQQKETLQQSDSRIIKEAGKQPETIINVVPETKIPNENFPVFEVLTKPVTDPTVKIVIDPEVPEGLNYRIQLGVFSKPVTPAFFKGITPVFGVRIPGGNMTRYYAGMFIRSSDANKALASVKATGFKDAFVVAFSGNNPISADKAAILEKE
jgi:hypothetical protein